MISHKHREAKPALKSSYSAKHLKSITVWEYVCFWHSGYKNLLHSFRPEVTFFLGYVEMLLH